jgi:small subunit ribosomal protein S2
MVDEAKNDIATNDAPSEKPGADQVVLEEMARAGILYGRRKNKTHPRMRPFIFTTRNGIEILDIEQTITRLETATKFIKDIIKRKGTVLFVGTSPASKQIVRTVAEKSGFPYVTERWLGGTLTNFKTILTRVQYFIKLKSDRAAGRLEKYTKKERLDFDKEIERFTHLMSGLESITRVPDAIFIVGASEHMTAIREARRVKIPIIGVLTNDIDPDLIDFPIPANDRAKSSVLWIMERVERAIAEGKAELAAMPQTEAGKVSTK